MSANVACLKFTFTLRLTHAECSKSVIDILLSVDVPVLLYYSLL